MLRTGRWKLVVHHGLPASAGARSGQLFDLRADRQESQNLWSDPKHREQRSRLTEIPLDVLVAAEDRRAPRLADW